MNFKPEDELLLTQENGKSERVWFVEMSEFPLARPTVSAGGDEGAVRTFPGPEAAARVRRADGTEATVFLADLRCLDET